jgi:putative chitinase
MLSIDFLKKLAPPPSGRERRAIWESYADTLTSPEAQALLEKFGIVHERRLAHFLAQIAHESGGFTLVWESGTYSAERIMAIFGVGKHSAKVTPAEAKRLAGNGPALFERVYGLGNPKKARELGNREPGDGWRFRGCGLQQITGRAAHERYAALIGCPVSELWQPINGLHAACLEWNDKRCNPLADGEDGTDRALRAITKRINGGYNGLADRRGYLRKAQRLLKAAPVVVSRTPADRPPIIEIGDDGQDVRQLQELLVKAGYVVPVDGIMGPRTEAALSGFQVNHGLVATGRADDATWEMLRQVTAETTRTPKTRQVDEEKLARESVVYKVLGRIRFWVSWVRTVLLGLTIGEVSGLEVVESTISVFKRLGAVWTEMNLPAAFGSKTAVVALSAGALIFILWLVERLAKKGQEDRKDDAELGGNLAV